MVSTSVMHQYSVLSVDSQVININTNNDTSFIQGHSTSTPTYYSGHGDGD